MLFRDAAMIAMLLPLGWCDCTFAQEPVVRVIPERVSLRSPEVTEQLLVLAQSTDGQTIDVTREAAYAPADTRLVAVTVAGRVLPLRDGQTALQVEWRGQRISVPLEVSGIAAPPPVSFQRDVIPILSKASCNSGGCHGKAEGQNGFKLSVFGYDVVADHQAITLAGRGRRVFPASPDRSLLLLKATAIMPHGGGQKVEPGSSWYRLLRRWIEEGVRGADSDETSSAATLAVAIAVEPTEIVLPPKGTHQLRVTAVLASGERRNVTAEAEYQSNNEGLASADRDGLVGATEVPGEAAILVRYLGHVAVCRVTRPRLGQDFVRPPEANFVDTLVWNKLNRLQVPASPRIDDATFLRRVYLDTIGTLPTSVEARQFLAAAAHDPLGESSAARRRQLVQELLERTEYADYWAQRWSDILQADKDTITPQGVFALSRWVRKQIATNVPYDQFARTILTAQGATLGDSPAAFFQVQSDAEKAARAVSQLFLGVRIECAQCHHHPFERWDQKDYFALAGFFTGIERKPSAAGGMKIVAVGGLNPNLNLKHPRTGLEVVPAGFGAPPANLSAGKDRRLALAAWATSADNPYFTRAIVNRIWAHYFGRGLVEPVDDLRATNPASNEPLLDALAAHLVSLRYDVKAFTRTLLESTVYQLSADSNPSNQLDEQNFSHAAWKPLPAEVLLDAVSQATGMPEEFNGWPLGYRAIQVWDNKLPSDFLSVFGRPSRQTVCVCERGTEPSIAQALHLMNAERTTEKIRHPHGRARRLAESTQSPDEIVSELYLATFSRFPNDSERQWMLQAFGESSHRVESVEDILWTLLNSKEFVFNH